MPDLLLSGWDHTQVVHGRAACPRSAAWVSLGVAVRAVVLWPGAGGDRPVLRGVSVVTTVTGAFHGVSASSRAPGVCCRVRLPCLEPAAVSCRGLSVLHRHRHQQRTAARTSQHNTLHPMAGSRRLNRPRSFTYQSIPAARSADPARPGRASHGAGTGRQPPRTPPPALSSPSRSPRSFRIGACPWVLGVVLDGRVPGQGEGPQGWNEGRRHGQAVAEPVRPGLESTPG